jgi:hypothetical protein
VDGRTRGQLAEEQQDQLQQPQQEATPSSLLTPETPPSDHGPSNNGLNRFQSFIEDNLGEYAPTFRTQDDARDHESSAQFDFGLHNLEDPIRRLEVDMRTRPTLDLELQFASLDAADMDYLKAKGMLPVPVP